MNTSNPLESRNDEIQRHGGFHAVMRGLSLGAALNLAAAATPFAATPPDNDAALAALWQLKIDSGTITSVEAPQSTTAPGEPTTSAT